ncbi:MAG: glycoside hydrolase family 127 protein [Lachnospiraceae bacterium]|nr:glycoside hydrolase family 127 protein [Lachnospiraceae bacterium]
MKPMFESLSVESKYTGILDDAFRYIEDFQLLNPTLWRRFVQQFREDADFEGGWRCEYWGKMMRGACFVYSYTRNPQLFEILKTTVSDMMESADEQGRISSYAVSHEFDAWDIWGRKYVLLGMQYFMEICPDENFNKMILTSMCGQMDYIISKIGEGEGKKPITSATRHWRGLNSCSLLEPVVRLYALTEKPEYLEFAEYIISLGGTDVANLFDLAYADELYPYQYPVTKAYEMTSCFEGLMEYYFVKGGEKYKQTLIHFANKVLESDFTVIGCAGCTHELFDHSTARQANTDNGDTMQETCVTVTLMKFFYRMTLLTGDSRYADAFETSLYNAYLGAINTDKVIEPMIAREHPDWAIEPLPFDSYSPLTAGTRGNGVGGLKVMSDKHYYGCCACIGAAGIGMVPKMHIIKKANGLVMNLFIPGEAKTVTPVGQELVFNTTTQYPKEGTVKVVLHLAEAEEFAVSIRRPYWSKHTKISVNGDMLDVKDLDKGYIEVSRCWTDGDEIALELDMRAEAIRPIPYGSQVLMNEVIWGHNYMIPTFDKEDPIAKNHIAIRRGPIMLAQENRLGYSVDVPVSPLVGEDGYVDVVITDGSTAPYPHIIEAQIPTEDGGFFAVTDYASAGKLWTEESKMAVWMLTK